MTRKIADLAVKVGTYIKDGQDKNRYKNVGTVLETDKGGKMYLLDRTFNPAGVPNPDNRDTIILSVFEVDGDKKPSKPSHDAPSVPDDSDIPF